MAKRGTAGKIESLVTRVDDLESLGARIQGDDELTGMSAFNELDHRYNSWYAEALAILPEAEHERFRFEFNGNAFQWRIKHFLQDPRLKSPLYRDDLDEFGKQFVDPWQYTYKDCFLKPIRQQKLILIEARARLGINTATSEALDLLEELTRRLPAAFSVLGEERHNKPAITIEDEYDVQRVLHAVAVLHFSDVRAEEPTPTKAGASSRLDFLLKDERVAVETKMIRPGLTKRRLRDELVKDIHDFDVHPDAGGLFIFIYDPKRKIANPVMFERDLHSDSDDFPVRVVIAT